MSWHKFRKGLQFVHLWAGLILAIPFVLIGLSGSIIIAMDLPMFKMMQLIGSQAP